MKLQRKLLIVTSTLNQKEDHNPKFSLFVAIFLHTQFAANKLDMNKSAPPFFEQALDFYSWTLTFAGAHQYKIEQLAITFSILN